MSVEVCASTLGPWVEIAVSDDGRGIEPAAVRERALAKGVVGETELAARLLGAIEAHATLGTPPVIASLRDRALSVAADLAASLGDERYAALHREGASLPVGDVVYRTRSALLGR